MKAVKAFGGMAACAWFFTAVAALAGCLGTSELFPREAGVEWTYSIRTGFGAESVEDVRLVRTTAVAGAEGMALIGAFGESRLAWRDGALWVESLANTGFSPAAPIVAADGRFRSWKGTITTAFGEESASGRLRQRNAELTVAGRKFATVEAELELERPLGTTRITTWFAPKIGILRQEQRTRGSLDVRLEWVAGPRSAH